MRIFKMLWQFSHGILLSPAPNWEHFSFIEAICSGADLIWLSELITGFEDRLSV